MNTPAGLSTAEAGPNEFERHDTRTVWSTLLGQLKGTMFWLLVAAGVSSAIGEQVDAVAIAAILVINVVVGFLQEYRAEKSIHALRALAASRARVLRDGHVVDIEAMNVVPGDLMVLEAGDVVPADGELVEAHQLQTFRALSARDNQKIFWRTGIFTNRGLLWVVGLTLVLQVALVELSFTRALFKLAPLTASQLALTCGLGLVVVTLIELAKLARKARRRWSAEAR